MADRTDILNLSPQELAARLETMGCKKFRTRQILDWIYKKHETRFDRMTTLSKALRGTLKSKFIIGGVNVEEVVRSKTGATAKYLFRLADGECVEAVSMRDGRRHTVCISSQVGCAMGCTFCATGHIGFKRNLTAGEILVQPIEISHGEVPITNVVFMGMGEPLLNLPDVLKAIDALADPERFALGARKIILSTCGIPEGIRKLAQSPIPVNLALSLNSPFQQQRTELMPIARKHPLKKVIAACAAYADLTDRRVTLEYVLLHGVNTDRRTAAELARIAASLDNAVNLIAYNPTPGGPFAPPTTPETLRFRKWLEQEAVRVTIRFRRGREIAAACGQLAGKR